MTSEKQARAFAFEDAGNPMEAERLYRLALSHDSGDALARFNLGRLYHHHGALDKAVVCFARVASDNPKDAEAKKALADILLDLGDARGAVSLLRNTSDRLFAACHLSDAGMVDKLHQHFGASIMPSVELPNTDRIAYISPDFKTSTVMKFFLPVVTTDDYCYSDTIVQDDVTQKVRRHCGRWRETSAMSDDEVIEQLRRDDIGIVVDLCGHMPGHRRVSLFSKLKNSFSYIRYPRPTGIPGQRMIADSVIGNGHEYLDVPGGCFAYQGDPTIAPVTKAVKRVFGSTNRPGKFDEGLYRCWAKIVSESGGTLRLLVPGGESNRLLRENIERSGVASDALELLATGSGYWEFVKSLDCLLDARSYSGVTTVADAIWAGVPVVGILGDSPQGRLAASVLTTAGLSDWVASSEDDYVRIALGEQMSGAILRNHLMGSALMDGKRVRQAIICCDPKRK